MYGDKPYIYHLVMVADQFESDLLKTIAYLHDTIEDTHLTKENLKNVFGATVADAVDAMSRKDDESYEEFIQRVKQNPLSKMVKIADLRANLREGAKNGRLKERYEAALKELVEVDDAWWCCGADYPHHEERCVNYRREE
jgi:(p)ppGpp synthase/HD superfamily hydrolase